jgi:predicted extracellular nuclease
MASMANGRGVLALSLAAACAPSLDLDERFAPAGRSGCVGELAPHDVQGPGDASPFEGRRLRVAGVVTLVDERARAAGGFFMQSLAEDGDPRSSEGLFVSFPGAAPAPETSLVVVGRVVEQAGETRLDAVEQLEACGRSALIPAAVDRRQLDALEPLEHMLIEAHADWTVLDVSEATLQSGALVLSPHGRLFSPGHELGVAPPASAGDGSGRREPAPWRLETVPAAAADVETLPRRGARVAALTGVVAVEATGPRLLVHAPPVWIAPIPPAPARQRAGGLRVVGLNLHDYFVETPGRGARSEQELQRQRAKLLAALRAVDADVLALTELENVGSEALEHLLDGLGAPDARELVFLEESPPEGSELRAGIAYRPGRLLPRGPAWFDSRAGFRRPPLFQSFETDGGPLTLGVVHFKSKRCGDEPTVVETEGCGADTRLMEAELLLASLRTLRGSRPLEPLLVMGDLNSDPLEAPVVALGRGGLVDLLGPVPSSERYSFVHEARASLLDHALGSPELAARTFGAAIWHINADEAAFRDYSLANPPAAFVADARRSSDHDPVIIDLEF